MPSFLITGGCGFVGRHLSNALLSQGNQVTVVDESLRVDLVKRQPSSDLRSVAGSLANRATSSLDDLVRESDYVFHLAARHNFKDSSSRLVLDANYKATQVLLDAVAKHKRRTIVASSYEVYPDPNTSPVDEASDLRLDERRGCVGHVLAKIADECMARELSELATIARVFPTVGPGQRNFVHPMPMMLSSALQNLPIKISHTGEEEYGFLHIDDLVRWLTQLVQTESAIGKTVNIGNPTAMQLAEIACCIIKDTKSESEIHFAPLGQRTKFKDSPKPSISLLETLVGASPYSSTQEAIHLMSQWARSAQLPLIQN